MNRILITILLFVLCFGLYAQWSTDAATPNQIYGLTSSQVIPKTAVTSEGITWIAWMDNTAGNYNTFLQKLDISGTPEWTTPLLVSNHPTMTWLTEWDMDCDVDGNAVLCFQDIRSVTNNIVIYKISPSGDFLWGNDGIMLSEDDNPDIGNMSPTVLCLPDGRTIAAWQKFGDTTATYLQSITDLGAFQWGVTGIIISAVSDTSYTWPQLLASDNSDVLVKYYEDTGPFWAPTRKILVQKYNAAGLEQWLTPTYVQNQGGLAAWNQWLSLTDDGMGGMIICWHEDRDATNISYTYIQRVLTNGTVTMPTDGVRVSMENGFHQFYPKVAFEPTEQEAYVFWNRVNGNQNQWGLQMQKLALDGARQWGENGMSFVNIGLLPTFPINAMNMQSGVVFLYDISPVEGNDLLGNIKAYCVNPEGLSVWNGGYSHIAINVSQKLHYDSDAFGDMWGIVTWEDGGGPSNVYAMRFNYNGTLGMIEPTPYNLAAEMVGENSVMLTWEFPDMPIMPIGYKIYRNDILLTQVDGGDTLQYLVEDLGPGLWSFYVTALNEDLSESPPSNEITVNITGTQDDIIIPQIFALSVYPNPFRSVSSLNVKGIRAADKTTISIYNVKGQMVRQVSYIGKQEIVWNWDGRDKNNIPVSPGVFFVRIISGQNRASAKLMKY